MVHFEGIAESLNYVLFRFKSNQSREEIYLQTQLEF